jgi:Flp pilus assembly protein TadG
MCEHTRSRRLIVVLKPVRERTRLPRDIRDDAGGAIVEFIAITLLLLIPVTYLVVAVSRVQAGILAAESAAHDAARAAMVAGVRELEAGASYAAAIEIAQARAQAVTAVNAANFGFAEEDAELALGCSRSPCLSLGSNITADVELKVALPGVPGFVGRHVPLYVTVGGSARAPVDGLAAES